MNQKSDRKRLFLNHRRHFLKLILGGFSGLGLLFSLLAAGMRRAWVEAKKNAAAEGDPGGYAYRQKPGQFGIVASLKQ